MPLKIENIVIHWSASAYGCAVEIDRKHRLERGWNRIGYGGVFLNGYPNYECWKQNDRHRFCDGFFEWGRPFDSDDIIETNEVEAHAFGWNRKSIGLCYVGGFEDVTVTSRQLINMRCMILHYLLPMWPHLTIKDVIGHNEVPGARTECPGIDMDLFRHFLVDYHLLDDFYGK